MTEPGQSKRDSSARNPNWDTIKNDRDERVSLRPASFQDALKALLSEGGFKQSRDKQDDDLPPAREA